MKGDLGSFFGQSDFLLLDSNTLNRPDEVHDAWSLVQRFCPNDFVQIGQMIGLVK